MLTREILQSIIEEKKVEPKKNHYDKEKEYKNALKNFKSNFEKLLKYSNYYDLIFDKYIYRKKKSEEKDALIICLDLLNHETIRIKKCLKIHIPDNS